MSDPAGLSRELRARAAEAGFAELAVTAVTELQRDRGRLDEWLGLGYQAGMGYMQRHRDARHDPGRLLPECKSIALVAVGYWRDESDPLSDGRVARYARARDYHKSMGRPLRRLADWLAEASGMPARAFVDTGPVLERAWAERAGLGWIGKNANLISRERGSWLLLGELLSAAELEPDGTPHADFCGSCTACIDACPTAAIVEPGMVDARRCISYWTIEHRGPIPREAAAALDGWIFGCDVCQEVCPWNLSFAREEPRGPFEPREGLDTLDPIELLGLDEAAFRERFAGTPLMRARWDGMLRNACALLGSRGGSRAIAALVEALGHRLPVVRIQAADALGRLGVAGPLGEAASAETDPVVGEAIAAALSTISSGG